MTQSLHQRLTGEPEASGPAPRFAEVAVNSDLPHRQTFSYTVPAGLDLQAGHAVYVPFGKLTLQGIVLEVHETPVFSEPEKIRSIRSLVGERPLLDLERVALVKWVADEYLAPIFDAAALALPPRFERRPQTNLHPLVERDEIDGMELSPRQREVMLSICDGARDLDALRAEVTFSAFSPILAQLEARGLLMRSYSLARPAVTGKNVELVSLVLPPDEAHARVDALEPAKHSRRAAVLKRLLQKRQISSEEAARLAGSQANLGRLIRAGGVRLDRDAHNIELALSRGEALAEARKLTLTRRAEQAHTAIRAIDERGELAIAELRKDGLDAAVTRWLTEAHIVSTRRQPVERDPLEHLVVARRSTARLLPAQVAAATAICAAIDGAAPRTFLLHGVTGSGKTEVYLQALDHCVAHGRRAIVLVPEIALTAQTVRRFRERFERVAILHSGLSAGEAFDQWHGIAEGRYDVVIGSRSAIFAPQPDLALIVLDEEHEWTYKQHDPQPRYHARDVAIELARLKGATVVLGSATPDVCSFERAERGDYTLLALPERVRPVSAPDGSTRPEASPALPEIAVVDLRQELRSGNRSMFSAELKSAIERVLHADDQVILFLNRRGLAGHVQCRDCGYVPECSSCAVALTFHKQYDRLVCHQCNRQMRLPAICRECRSPRIRLLGGGIEKVETEAARLFPHARSLRWDRDATRTRHDHGRILASLLAHDADILIGTQMLAKGLDLPSVTLVGVMNADVGLHIPDFRTGERTFQLLTQVAGRAGRGHSPGRVIIQTYTPDHYAIDAAARYDYDAFAGAELEARRRSGYPPFGRLLRLTFSHPNPRAARDEAIRVRRALSHRRAQLGSDVEVLEPAPAYVPRLRGRWRWQILLHGRDPASVVRDFILPPNWSIDVDPVGV